jgi:hypothetical protein
VTWVVSLLLLPASFCSFFLLSPLSVLLRVLFSFRLSSLLATEYMCSVAVGLVVTPPTHTWRGQVQQHDQGGGHTWGVSGKAVGWGMFAERPVMSANGLGPSGMKPGPLVWEICRVMLNNTRQSSSSQSSSTARSGSTGPAPWHHPRASWRPTKPAATTSAALKVPVFEPTLQAAMTACPCCCLQVRFPKVPGQATVADELSELKHKAEHAKGVHHLH